MFIVGEGDKAVPPGDAAVLAATISGARSTRSPTRAIWRMRKSPKQVSELILGRRPSAA